jgi:lipopolysaccharide heptosyltransferase II
MNIKHMKFMDEFFGPLICLALHIYNGVKKLFHKPSLYPINNILLLKFFGMGSILHAGPMLRALKKTYPNATIGILTFEQNKEICELTGFFDRIETVTTKGIVSLLISIIKNIFTIRKHHYDVVIDLEFFSKSSTIIAYLSGARIRVGYYLIQYGIILKMMWRGNLLTHPVYYNPHKHITEAFLALANAIGADTKDRGLAKLTIKETDASRIDKILRENNVSANDYFITININSSPLCLERRWPLNKFAYLVNRLLENEKIKIALIGSKEDKPYVNSFLSSLDTKSRILNLAGATGIGEVAALISKSNLIISNDSGPLHIAESMDKPTVSFFGPEIPIRYGPRDHNKHIIFYGDIYCSPCINVYNQKTAPCNGKNICMDTIDAQQVFEMIKEKYLQKLF